MHGQDLCKHKETTLTKRHQGDYTDLATKGRRFSRVEVQCGELLISYVELV